MTRALIKKHRYKIVAGAPIIFLFLLNTAGSLGGNALVMGTSDTAFPSVGDAVPVHLEMFTKTPVNAVGGTIRFAPEILRADSVTRSTSIIDLWSEEPIISNTDGSIHWSGGIVTNNTVENMRGTVFVINFRALKQGKVKLMVRDGELLANNGAGTNVLSGSNTLTIYVREQGQASPDVNQDGALSLSDVNSLYISTFGAYDKRHDLNSDGKVSWDDVRFLVSIL